MTANLPDNVKLQVSLISSNNYTVNQTKLLSKNEIVNKISDWVPFFYLLSGHAVGKHYV